jgi:hypothetical protein
MKFADNRKENTFTVEEKYKIPTFWKPMPNGVNQVYLTIQPLSITNYFDVPKNIQQRTLPYSLTYPVDYYHTIHINLPLEFEIKPVEKIIETAYYQYESEIKKNGTEISKLTHYKTKQDHIPADHIQKYVNDHTEMFNELVYELTYNKDIVEASNKSWPGIFTTIVSLVGGVFLCFYLYRKYDPAPARYMVRGQQIGGWLILVAFGLVISPFRLLVDLVQAPDILTGAAWMSFLAVKNYGATSFLIFSHIYNVVKLMFMLMLIVLFFQRRSSFPMLMSIHLAVHLIIISADTLLARGLAEDPESIPMKDAIVSLIATAIWVPYLNISQRVKETFVIRGPEFGDDENDNESPPESPVLSEEQPAAL